jgi:hypothetical protein
VVGVGRVCSSLVAPRRGWALAAVPGAGVLALGFAGAKVSLHCLRLTAVDVDAWVDSAETRRLAWGVGL